MIRILFVCMGNICRSPTAEGVLRSRLAQCVPVPECRVDSAGTHAYHIGSQPDLRSQAVARSRGVDLSGQQARQVAEDDFVSFDFILAMDADNLSLLKQRCPAQYQDKLGLFLAYAPHTPYREVPDPYYDGDRGFEQVLDLIEEASDGLIQHLWPHTHNPLSVL